MNFGVTYDPTTKLFIDFHPFPKVCSFCKRLSDRDARLLLCRCGQTLGGGRDGREVVVVEMHGKRKVRRLVLSNPKLVRGRKTDPEGRAPPFFCSLFSLSLARSFFFFFLSCFLFVDRT